MNQRTCNIIMCCKGRGKGETKRERVINYLSEECACPVEAYTDDVLRGILKEAVMDYIDTCDRPSAFIWQYCDVFSTEDPIERLLVTFELLAVRGKEFEYINGFTEELLKQSDIDLHVESTGLKH